MVHKKKKNQDYMKASPGRAKRSQQVCLEEFDYGWIDAVMALRQHFVKHESETCQTGSVLVCSALRKASISDH